MEWYDNDSTRDLLCNTNEVGPHNVVKTLLKLTKSKEEKELEKKLDIQLKRNSAFDNRSMISL
jgi:hypothetical protein